MKMKSEELQKKIIEMNMLGEAGKRLEQEFSLLESQEVTLQKLREDILEVGGKENPEILTNLGSGVFAKAKLLDSRKLLVNIGGGCVVERNFEEAVRIVENQIKKVVDLRAEIQRELLKNVQAVSEIENELKSVKED